MEKYSLLESIFGYKKFRNFQEESIDALLDGRDVLTILPTGGGKSLCYQLPSLMMDGVTVVISPLIALMQDQVRGLSENGIEARTINSDMSEEERIEVFESLKNGTIKLLYIAPERMVLPSFIAFLQCLKINFFVVDEAHCVSEWGHEFRADYRQLSCLKTYFPETAVAAFTATATAKVADDIQKALHLENPYVSRGDVYRKNIFIQTQKRIANGRVQLLHFLQKYRGECGIVYTFTRKETEELALFLQSKGISARAYHARLDKEEKADVFHDFLYDKLQIVVATIAFGMGIDKSNIRFVVHMSLPKTIENYYQEIGRAGRDGLESETLLLYTKADEIQKRELMQHVNDSVYQNVLYEKLQKMYRFAMSNACKHKLLGTYFGDASEVCKDRCDSCLKEPVVQRDISKEAQMFLSTIYRTGAKFGQHHLIDVLRGSQAAKVLQFGHDKLSVYGIGKEHAKKVWELIVDRLHELEALAMGEHRALIMTEVGVEILKGAKVVEIDEDKLGQQHYDIHEVEDVKRDETFESFRSLRMKIATELDVPAYIVFSDKTLKDMAQKLPQTKIEMLEVNGIGEAKYKKYGEAFLALCQELSDA